MTPTWTDIAGARLGVACAGLKASGGDDVVVLYAPGVAAAVTVTVSLVWIGNGNAGGVKV